MSETWPDELLVMPGAVQWQVSLEPLAHHVMLESLDTELGNASFQFTARTIRALFAEWEGV